MLSCCVPETLGDSDMAIMDIGVMRGEPGKTVSLGETDFDMMAMMREDPIFKDMSDEELRALCAESDAELGPDLAALGIGPDGKLLGGPGGPMGGMMGGPGGMAMEPFPCQQAIPPVPAVPEDAPVVKAVLVAPTYQGSKHGVPMLGNLDVLLGSIGAVEDILAALQHAQVRTPQLKILTDATKPGGWPVEHEAPTRKKILSSMEWLVQDAKPGDSLLFFFAGHGGQQRDTDGDEEDGMDEHICPVVQPKHPNFHAALEGSLEKDEVDDLLGRAISDDEVFQKMLQDLPEGVRLTTIFDACHSQTMADLGYSYMVHVQHDEMARAKRQEPPPPGFSFDKRPLICKDLKGKTTAASVLCIAGCQDRERQQTWCDQSGPGMRGAFFLTNMLAKAIAGMRTPNPTYADVLREITRDYYRGNRMWMSVPSFSTTSAIDLDAKPFSFVGPL